MIPTLLITLREAIEASLVVATILGILVKVKQNEHIKTVWLASLSALLTSFVLVLGGSIIGVNVRRVFEGGEFEGLLYILSAFFVTWAVFFLHNHFAQQKMQLLSRIRDTIARDGIFAFTFIAVLREGIEITLFLSTLYLTNPPLSIISGFFAGTALGLLISFLFFRATLRIPVYWAFRMTSFLLIMVAGGLLARGVSAFIQEGMLPEILLVTPRTELLPLSVSLTYIYIMHRWVFVRSR